MNRTQRRRLALLLAAACLVGALTAAVALGAARRGDERALSADGSFRMTLPGQIGSSTLSWSAGGGGDDVIVVPGSKCPKSHPHKVGSSSADSWSQVNGGPVRHSSHRRSYCAR
jgi:hypothetical protein